VPRRGLARPGILPPRGPARRTAERPGCGASSSHQATTDVGGPRPLRAREPSGPCIGPCGPTLARERGPRPVRARQPSCPAPRARRRRDSGSERSRSGRPALRTRLAYGPARHGRPPLWGARPGLLRGISWAGPGGPGGRNPPGRRRHRTTGAIISGQGRAPRRTAGHGTPRPGPRLRIYPVGGRGGRERAEGPARSRRVTGRSHGDRRFSARARWSLRRSVPVTVIRHCGGGVSSQVCRGLRGVSKGLSRKLVSFHGPQSCQSRRRSPSRGQLAGPPEHRVGSAEPSR
jgi:hypothetical protein